MTNNFTISGSAVTVTTYGYASASDVASFSRNLLGSEANFSTSTSPNITSVNNWLSSGCGIINAKLANAGYTTPIAEGTQLREWLMNLNAIYGAAQAEMSRINITLGPGERTRGQIFEKMFWDQLKDLLSMDLTTVGGLLGSTTLSSMSMFVGGISQDSKDTYNDDTDRVKPHFSRGMFDMPGTINVTQRTEVDD